MSEICVHFTTDEVQTGVHGTLCFFLILLDEDGSKELVNRILGCECCKFLANAMRSLFRDAGIRGSEPFSPAHSPAVGPPDAPASR